MARCRIVELSDLWQICRSLQPNCLRRSQVFGSEGTYLRVVSYLASSDLPMRSAPSRVMPYRRRSADLAASGRHSGRVRSAVASILGRGGSSGDKKMPRRRCDEVDVEFRAEVRAKHRRVQCCLGGLVWRRWLCVYIAALPINAGMLMLMLEPVTGIGKHGV